VRLNQQRNHWKNNINKININEEKKSAKKIRFKNVPLYKNILIIRRKDNNFIKKDHIRQQKVNKNSKKIKILL
jgi:hypothetical protein